VQTIIQLEEASTHKNAKTHADTAFVTRDLDLLTAVVGSSVIILMSLLILFPFWVAVEQKSGQG